MRVAARLVGVLISVTSGVAGIFAIIYQAANLPRVFSVGVLVRGWPAVVMGTAFLVFAMLVFLALCLPTRYDNSVLKEQGVTILFAVFGGLIAVAAIGGLLGLGAV